MVGRARSWVRTIGCDRSETTVVSAECRCREKNEMAEDDRCLELDFKRHNLGRFLTKEYDE